MAESKSSGRRAPAKKSGSSAKGGSAKKSASGAKGGSAKKSASGAKGGSAKKSASGAKRSSSRSRAKGSSGSKPASRSKSATSAKSASKPRSTAKAKSGARAKSASKAKAASGSGAKPKTAGKPETADKSRAVEETARSYFEALARRDVAAAASHFHPQGIDDVVPVGVFRGPGEVRAFFSELFAAVPDFKFHIERVVAGERTAAVEYRVSGTFDGAPFQGIEPTGRSLELRGCDLTDVEDGKIMRNTGYYDGAAFARGIGLLPAQDSGAERAMTGAFNLMTKARRVVSERKPGS